MTAKKRNSPKLGEIYAIPLPDGRFSFSRYFRQRTFGVFDFTSNKIDSPIAILSTKIAFSVCCYEEPTRTGEWIYVGRFPFKSNDDGWHPPIYIRDSKDPRCCTVYFRNESWSALPKDVEGMESVRLWSVKMIMERIKHQIIDCKPWDMKAHSLYDQDLERKYGPNYESVIAEKFSDVPWPKWAKLPGTMIDSCGIDHFLKQPIGTSLLIKFMSENAARQMDEISERLNELLVEADVGGVVDLQRQKSVTDGVALGYLQLRVFRRADVLKVVKALLKEKGLLKETDLSFEEPLTVPRQLSFPFKDN